jgi:hypothetical protein
MRLDAALRSERSVKEAEVEATGVRFLRNANRTF